jgi:hypothetical protein
MVRDSAVAPSSPCFHLTLLSCPCVAVGTMVMRVTVTGHGVTHCTWASNTRLVTWPLARDTSCTVVAVRTLRPIQKLCMLLAVTVLVCSSLMLAVFTPPPPPPLSSWIPGRASVSVVQVSMDPEEPPWPSPPSSSHQRHSRRSQHPPEHSTTATDPSRVQPASKASSLVRSADALWPPRYHHQSVTMSPQRIDACGPCHHRVRPPRVPPTCRRAASQAPDAPQVPLLTSSCATPQDSWYCHTPQCGGGMWDCSDSGGAARRCGNCIYIMLY